MKQLFRFWIVAALLLAAGCAEVYDDSALVDRVDDLESRVQKLEQLCQQMNTNISSLQTIVTALQNNDYVTACTPLMDDGVQIGYTITFAKSGSMVIYHGKDGQNGSDGKDGADGKDGYTPVIGIKQDTDGIYYWTLDGEWLLDDAGNKIEAQGVDGKDGEDGKDGTDGINGADGKDGITPQLKIENDYWYVSYDNGASWTQLGKATGEDGKDGTNGTDGTNGADGKSFFQDVTQDDNNVYFTLADGTVITVPKGVALSIEFAESDLVVMSPNSSREIGYTVTSATETVKVEVTSSADIKAKVVVDDANGLTGQIHITTGDAIDEYCKVIVFVSNGDKVIMRSITFEEAGLVVEENATKQATSEGGEMTLEFLSNIECEVVIPEEAQSWISVVPATRAMEKQTITLKLEPNEGAARSAELIVESVDGKLSLTYTISQEPNLDYQLALEREALIAIYNALDGDNWTNNDNWCSDKPVSEWYGVGVNELGYINSLVFPESNGVKGAVPEDIGSLIYLEEIVFCGHQISSFPQELGNLSNLKTLQVNNCELVEFPEEIINLINLENLNITTGMEIPQSIGNLINLQNLTIRGGKGTIPASMGNLTKLKVLDLGSSNYTGKIPIELGNCRELRLLSLCCNNLEGKIPEELINCLKLEGLDLSDNELSGEVPNFSTCTELRDIDLSNNELSGVFPADIFSMVNLNMLNLQNNQLKGNIPISVKSKQFWEIGWGWIISNNAFTFDVDLIPAPVFEVNDIDENRISSSNLYSSNEYTILYQFSLYFEIENLEKNIIPQLKQMYSLYADNGISIIGYCHEYSGTRSEFYNHQMNNDISWPLVYWTSDNSILGINENNSAGLTIGHGYNSWYPYNSVPTFIVVDNNGNVVCYDLLSKNTKAIQKFVVEKLGSKYDNYISTDYSTDGDVTTLQTATNGDGIDIVLMGDAYSDRQIADGTYEADMENLYNNLFTEEPYKSFKDHFNVYYVNVVSATEGYEYGNTALDGYFGDGTLVGGNDNAVFNYALKAISEEEMDEALLIVAMNSDNYAGTCYMYYPETNADYGKGVSVSYFPRGGDAETFAQLLHHEACGHGFAKLADEYAYEDMGTAPSDYVSEIKSQQTNWGWWKNVDFTSNPTATRWSHFINDTRYANERLGAYEGGLTYWSGVWRPTENSIMRYNTGGFNAPSREAIYYRIHKLAYGDSWEYDYEDFVEWDARNRTTAATRAMVYKPANYKPTHPPVIVNKPWRDAK